jgi:hypothetical protein
MNNDDLERQLRTQAGPREDGYRPIPLPPTAGEPPRATWSAATRIGLIGATVVAGAALALVLTHPPQGGPSVGSGGSAESSPSAQPSAQPTAQPQPVACRSQDFAWSTDPWGGAAGSVGTNVLLRGVSSLDACLVDGDVTIEIRDGSGQARASAAAVANLHAAAGEVFEIGIAWSNWCAAAPGQPLSAFLKLPGDGSEVPLIPSRGDVLVPPCNGEGQPTNLSVTNIQPSDRAFPEG